MLPACEVRIVEERGRLWVFVATNAHTDSFLAALGASGATEAVEVIEPFLDPTRVLGGSGYWVGLRRRLGFEDARQFASRLVGGGDRIEARVT
jgi:hypothetical protein